MRNAATAPGTGSRTPKPVGTTPTAYLPHPPLVSGGWYRGDPDHEVVGPGRFPVPGADEKSLGAALFWAALCGPLGLCYLSPAAGVLATAATAGLLLLTGGGVGVLVVVWVVVTASAVALVR